MASTPSLTSLATPTTGRVESTPTTSSPFYSAPSLSQLATPKMQSPTGSNLYEQSMYLTPSQISSIPFERYPTYYFGVDNEELYGQAQTTGEKWKNAGIKFLGLTATTFIGGTAGVVNGVIEAVGARDFSKFYDNDFTKSLADFSAEMEDKYANYTTRAYQNAAWYSPETWTSANFWADTVFKNAGFAVGAILSGGAWGKVFSLVGKAAQAIGRGAGWIDDAVGAAQTAARAEDALTYSRAGSTIQNLSSNLANTARQSFAANFKRNIGAYSQNLIRSSFAAAGEAQIEAYHTMDEYRKEAALKIKEETGLDPTEEQLKEINEISKQIGNSTFGLNMGLLTASNLIMFPKIFGKNFTAGKKVVGDNARTGGVMNVVDANGKVIRRGWNSKPKFDPTKGESLRAAGFGVKTGLQNQLERVAVGRVLNRVSPVAAAIFSPREAFEEGAQFVSAEFSKAFFDEGSDVKGSFMASFKKSLNKSLDTKDFWLGVMSGGISGGMMQTITPFNFGGGIREAIYRRKKGNEIANAINSTPLGNYTAELAQSVVRGEAIEQVSLSALLNGDRVQYEDSTNDSRLNYILPRVLYQRGDLVAQEIEAYREMASTEGGFAEMQAAGRVGEGVTRQEFLEGLNKMGKDFNTVSAVFEELNTRFGQIYKADGKTLKYNKDVLMRMAYNASKVDYYNGLLNEMSRELSAHGIDTAELMTYLSEEALLPKESSEVDGDVAVTKRAELSEGLQEYLGELRRYFEGSSTMTPDQIDSVMEQIADVAEVTARRRAALDEYQIMRDNPDAYNTTERLNEETDDVLSEEEEAAFEVGEETESPKRSFFRQNEGKLFTIDLGRRGTFSGTLVYNPKTNQLAVKKEDGTLYEITNQDFKDGLVRPEDNSVVVSEEFLNEVDPRTEAKRVETINNITELHREKGEQIGRVREEIAKLREDLSSLADKMLAEGVTPEMFSELAEMYTFWEGVLNDLELQQANLEEQEALYREILDEQRSDYNTVVKDVEAQLDDIGGLIGALETERNNLAELLNYMKDLVKSIAQRIKEKVDLIQKTRPTIVGEMLSGAMANTISVLNNPQVTGSQILEEFAAAKKALEDSRNAYNINDAQRRNIEQQIKAIDERIEFTSERLANIDKVYEELLGRHYDIIEPISPENFVDKDEAIEEIDVAEETKIETEEKEPKESKEDIELFEGKKKPLSRYFNSTAVLDDDTLKNRQPQWHKNLQKLLNRFMILPIEERRKIGVMFVHAGNLKAMGLKEDVMTHLYGNYYNSTEEMMNPDSGAIAVVFIKEEADGKRYYIDNRGSVIGEVGKENNSVTPEDLVMSKMTDTDLHYKVNRKGQTAQIAYVKPEEVSISPEELQAEYRKAREAVFANSGQSEVFSVTVSAGMVDTNNKETKAEGTILHKDDINGAEQLLTIIPPNTTYTTKNGTTLRAESQASVIVDTEDQATRMVVGKMNKDRATALLNALLRFGRKEASDQRVVDFIKGSMPQGVKFDAGNMTLTKGKKVIDLKPALDSNINSKDLHKLRDDVVTMFTKSRYNVSHPMMESFVEFDVNGLPIVHNTFQSYLLSSENREPLLFTNVSKTSRTNKYVTLKGFMEDWNIPQTQTEVSQQPALNEVEDLLSNNEQKAETTQTELAEKQYSFDQLERSLEERANYFVSQGMPQKEARDLAYKELFTKADGTLNNDGVAYEKLKQDISNLKKNQDLKTPIGVEEVRKHALEIKRQMRSSFEAKLKSKEKVDMAMALVETQAQAWSKKEGQNEDYFYQQFEEVTDDNITPFMPKISRSEVELKPATDVLVAPILALHTDESRFQAREQLNDGVLDGIAGKFNSAEQDPIQIWTDPKDGLMYILAGHHRYYGAVRAGVETVKVIDRSNDFTEEEAIKYAKEVSNANRSMETPIERAKTLRRKREVGDSKESIDEFLKNEGSNRVRVENLSYLNPKGKVMGALQSFESTQAEDEKRALERIADWIGEVRKLFKDRITDQHEVEMFDFLSNRELSKRFTTKRDFTEKVRSLVSAIDYNSNNPLNLARFQQKGMGEAEYDNKIAELKSRATGIDAQIKELDARFTDTKREDYISPETDDFENIKELARQQKEALKEEQKAIYRQILETQRLKGEYLRADANQGNLFNFQKKVVSSQTLPQLIKSGLIRRGDCK